MLEYIAIIPKCKFLELSNDKSSIQDYIINCFNKKIIEPNYYDGYITEILTIKIQEQNPCNIDIKVYISYKLLEDKEYEIIKERLQIGL